MTPKIATQLFNTITQASVSNEGIDLFKKVTNSRNKLAAFNNELHDKVEFMNALFYSGKRGVDLAVKAIKTLPLMFTDIIGNTQDHKKILRWINQCEPQDRLDILLLPTGVKDQTITHRFIQNAQQDLNYKKHILALTKKAQRTNPEGYQKLADILGVSAQKPQPALKA